MVPVAGFLPIYNRFALNMHLYIILASVAPGVYNITRLSENGVTNCGQVWLAGFSIHFR